MPDPHDTRSALRLYADACLTSPYAMSVFVALQEKALPFELAAVDLGQGGQHEPGYAHASLTQRVPTLEHNGFALSESSAITEYLDDTFPGVPLYPVDTRQRARARQLQAWLRSDLAAIKAERSAELFFYPARVQPLSAAARAAAGKLFAACRVLGVEEGGHLFGQWSVADLDLALMINRLALHGDDVPAPAAAYAAAQWQRPGVRQWMALRRPGR